MKRAATTSSSTEKRRHSSRSSMFERCTSTTGTVKSSSGVVDRPRVVRPRAGVDDHAVRPVVRLVAPVDELALVVRLPAAHGALELERPLVDPRLELGEAEAAVELGIAVPEHVEIDAVQDDDPHRLTLCDEGVESLADALRLDVGRHARLARRVEQRRAGPRRRAPSCRAASAAQAASRSTATGRRREHLLDGARLVVEPGERAARRGGRARPRARAERR